VHGLSGGSEAIVISSTALLQGALFLAPAVLLFAFLLSRGYPGERLLLVWVRPLRRRRRRPGPVLPARSATVRRPAGRLVAGREEIRGPPCVAV